MSNKVILITGATDGIGKQSALQLAFTGATIIVHGRHAKRIQNTVSTIKKTANNPNIYGVQADFSSLQEVRSMAVAIKKQFSQLNVLINNAGVFVPAFQKSKDGFELTFAINHLAHFLLTCLLIDLIQKSAPARIINVSSMAHSHDIDFNSFVENKNYSGYSAYAQSKLANILFTFKLAKRLTGSGITVNCLHPGVINTKLLRAGWGVGGDSPQTSAILLQYLATDPEMENITGKYFIGVKQEGKPAAIAYDQAIQDQLWKLSEQWCGCSFTLNPF